MYLIEKLEMTLDKNGYGGTIQTNPSKPFDTINHDCLILSHTFTSFYFYSLKSIKSYLTNGW